MSRVINRPDKTEDGFTIIYDPADVPEFRSDAEEVAFWESHTWSDELMEQAAAIGRDPDLRLARAKKQAAPISLRLDDNTTGRLKGLATRKGMGYQTLLKQFVLERLYEEEKREGVL